MHLPAQTINIQSSRTHNNLDIKHNREIRVILSPTSHNIQQQRQKHQQDTRENHIVEETQPIQTQEQLLHFTNSSIQKKANEACEVSLVSTIRTDEDHRSQSQDLARFVKHSNSAAGRRSPNPRDDQAERLEKVTLALEEPAPIRKCKQREANSSEQPVALTSKASRSMSLRNTARDRKEEPGELRLAVKETRVDLEGKAKQVVVQNASEKPCLVQSKAISAQCSTSQGSSGISPPRTLRSTRRGRETPDSAPVRELTLDQKTVEYLEPLTELESVEGIRDIHSWHAEWTSVCAMSKIAEGSYGSVFRMWDKKHTKTETIGKLMPLKPKSGVGSRRGSNTTIEAAVSEIKLLDLMRDVSGFVMFRGAAVLIGALPRALRNKYRAYTAREDGSDCGNSEAQTCFPKQQAWLFIEMDNAGVELDKALKDPADGSGLLQVSKTGQRYLTVKRTRDIFWGVVRALMWGEEIHGFEHRDLHLSNICVEVNTGTELDSGYELIPPATNVNVTIIDYTLSRANMPGNSPIFNPMKDETIFQGDSTFELQYDIYRHMRDLVADPKAANKGWDAYVPITNVLWLSLLLVKLMERTPRPEEAGEEQKLWDSLKTLQLNIDLDDRWSWTLLSACDVVRYMEVGWVVRD